MAYCEFCGDQIGYLPFTCKYCGGTFCKKHRLPENHECTFELKHVSVVPTTPRSSKKLYQDVDLAKPSSQEYLDQGPRALKKYLKRQERERKKTLRTYESSQKLYTKPTQFLGTKVLFVMIIGFSVAGIILSYSGLSQYIYLSLYSLINEYMYHTLFTSLFVNQVDFFGFFLLVFMLMLLYFMARNIEARKGSKFLIQLYIVSSLFSALVYFILRLSLSFVFPLESIAVYVGFAWGGILGLISYSLFPIMNQQITAMMYFLPLRLKGKTFLYIIILFRVIPLLFYLFEPEYFLLSTLYYLPDLGGILGSYLVYKSQLGR